MKIKQLTTDNYPEALALVEEVFMQYDAPTYPQSSIDEFVRSIHDPSYINILTIYAAYNDEGQIMGVLATRKEGTHIALFFVKEQFQRQGVGRALFNTACNAVPNTCITVFSSRYALDIYRHFGFVQTDTEQCDRGVYYTPFVFANNSISDKRF